MRAPSSCALGYDWRAQAASMRAAGLPEPFVETIETGWWTTCLEVVPPRERARGAYHVYREAMPSGFAAEGGGLDGRGAGRRPATRPAGGLAVRHRAVPAAPVDLHELPLQPGLRLLRGRQLADRAAPRAVRRRFRALVDEALREGFTELYVTGGEPFVHPDIVEMVEYAVRADRDRRADQRDAVHGPPARRAGAPGRAGNPVNIRLARLFPSRSRSVTNAFTDGNWAIAKQLLNSHPTCS